MEPEAGSTRRWVLWCAPLFALLAVGLLVGSQLDVGLNPADEGFLWYGVQRTAAGEVPMRDFQAYDPGRYVWCAAFTPLLGDGILGVRAATALFAALGVSVALLVAGRFTRHAGELLLCAFLFALWLFPRHKLFEHTLVSAAMWFAVRMLENPSTRAHFAGGVFVGLSAFFGRNHALYSGLALSSCALFLAWRRPELRTLRRGGAFALGVALGLVPLAAMLLLVPGFWSGYVRSLELVLQHGANLPLPYPFPWRTDWSALAGWELAGQLALAAGFLLPFVLLPAGFLVALRTPAERVRERAAWLAAFFVGAFYVHHVSVRSDQSHLAQSFPPLLMLALSLPAALPWKRLRTLVWAALVPLSALAALEGNTSLVGLRPDQRLAQVEGEVAGESLRLGPSLANELGALQDFARSSLPGETPIWIVNQPTLYAALHKVAPSWWLIHYWPLPEDEQRALIERLDQQGVDWALIEARQADGAGARDVPTSLPLVWNHLRRSFKPVALPGPPSRWQLLRRRP